MGIKIKDAELVERVTGEERIPVSDGSGLPKAMTAEQLKGFVGAAGDENVQSDWAETDPTSDAYIKHKPTIPNEVTEETIKDWGYTKNTGDYSKPSGGIPKDDLDKSVQESLGKADTAIQSHQDISHLATNSELKQKQDALVSGTNIKTINGQSLLGNGDIEIKGGGDGNYTKPESGIPKSDLDADVQDSLGKADTALQSVPEEYVTMDELDRLLSDSPFEFVDLGLPSGTLWATCNIGASKPEEAGLYFAWGETEGYKVSYTVDGNTITSTTITDKDGNATDKKFSTEHYKWIDKETDKLTKYNTDPNDGVVDNLTKLVLMDDAVYAVDRHSRMPSVADFEELIANTTFSKVVENNRACGKFTAANGKSIILPAVGIVIEQGISGINAWAIYPTRELYEYGSSECKIMYFTSSYSPRIGNEVRTVGLPIRAVKNKLYGNDDYYYTKEEIDAQKQDILVSSQNIKTINGESILGSGNIVIAGGSGEGGSLTESDILDMGFTKNEGTITEVKMNGVSKGTSGVVDLGKVITEHQDISGKQDVITDLETIREGAALGTTAIQEERYKGTISAVDTSGSVDEPINGVIETLPNGNINLTINGVSKDFMPATPSGDPMHHYYESLGAQWNDDDTDKTLQIPIYGKDFNTTDYFPVVHKSKRWYFNLLGDITNAQMANIVSYPRTIYGNYAYANCKARTIVYEGTGTGASVVYDYFGARSAIETLYTKSAMYPTSARNLFYVSYSIKYILGLPGSNRGYFIGYAGVDSAYNDCFINLIEIRIMSARKDIKFQSSPSLSKTSVLFMVNEAIPTTAITITLHPTAYARVANDEEVIAALDAKNAALQGTGGSVSIVSA